MKNGALFILVLGVAFAAAPCIASEADDANPIIYCTDLFHPPDDPDDHFDLATLYALPGVRVDAIILDQGGQQETSSGEVAVRQMNRICGRNVPCARGLAQPLSSPEDTGSTQPQKCQKGVKLLLSAMDRATTQMTIVCVGSLRDTAAAFNRDPEMFRQAISRIVVFAGEATADFQEHNVALDPHAYVRIMSSGLPIYWVPCFDGGLWRNEGHASYWTAQHADLLTSAPPRLANYFIHALVDQAAPDPLAYLDRPVAPQMRARLLAGKRNLWGAGVFVHLGGCRIMNEDGRYFVHHGMEESPGTEVCTFDFDPVLVRFDPRGVARYDGGNGSAYVMRFRVRDRGNYAAVMTAVTAGLLSRPGR